MTLKCLHNDWVQKGREISVTHLKASSNKCGYFFNFLYVYNDV